MLETIAEITRSALNLKELSDKQKKEYKSNLLEYDMLDKHYEQISQDLKTINQVIKTSARQYILSNEFDSSTRRIIQLFAIKYKLDQSKITQQIYTQ